MRKYVPTILEQNMCAPVYNAGMAYRVFKPCFFRRASEFPKYSDRGKNCRFKDRLEFWRIPPSPLRHHRADFAKVGLAVFLVAFGGKGGGER